MKAEIDRDALLADLHLPTGSSAIESAEKLPDVNALLSIQLFLSPASTPNRVQVVALADTNLLAEHGIQLDTTKWEQPVIKVVSRQTLPSLFELSAGAAVSDDPSDQGTYLSSLVDSNGYGYNMRAVCERIQQERDLFCRDHLGESYKTDKLQISFSVSSKGSSNYNIYQVCYRGTAESEDAESAPALFFRICLYNLRFGDDGSVVFDSAADCTAFGTDAECKQVPSPAEYESVILYGGGQRVSGRQVFDQNGFVIFPDQPTSYKMATGLYWSPTYDLLTEDMIWKLTAADAYSLAKVLRYARKEIYARYHAPFDQKTELEFYNHYRSYSWYSSGVDRSDEMTETERANMRLLREIQSLIEK